MQTHYFFKKNNIETIEEELFHTFESAENNNRNPSQFLEVDMSELNFSNENLMRNEQVQAENLFTFNGNLPENFPQKKEQLIQPSINEETTKGFVTSISDLNRNIETVNLEVSLLKKPINYSNDKVTVSMHIFQNIIHMNNKSRNQKVY